MNPTIMRNLSYGVYALGVKGEARPNACIVNTVFQVTSSPITVAVSVNHDNYSNKCIKNTGLFSVSVLSEDTNGAVIGTLGFNSGLNANKLKNVNHKVLTEGVPVIKEDTCCWFLCKVVDFVDTHTHTIFVGEVIAGSEKSRGVPMTYKYYHEVIKGTAPRNAPTYSQNEKPKMDFDTYICRICGYVYNDPDTPFEDLPDDWVCPVCKAPKSNFKLQR